MGLPNDIVNDAKICAVLEREHERARGDSDRLASLRPRIDAAKADGTYTFDLFPDDVYLAIEPAMGRFLYLAARALGAKRIVEFGTSFGISTVYLAAAARETGGHVVGSELVPEKAERARANLAEAGLAEYAEIRVGDALETLKNIESPLDILFLDGWKDVYLPVLDLLMPVLRPGAIVAADNIETFPEDLRQYMSRVSDPEGPFNSTLVPFESGLGFSILRGSQQHGIQSGRLAGIARKEKRRAPVETLESVAITADGGLEGDSRGRFADRAVTVLAAEDWAVALADAGLPDDTDWTLRRANLLTEGIELPRAAGGVVRVGDVLLETTGQTRPCSRMEEQRPGLQKALAPDWRGGVTCRVMTEGTASSGNQAQVLVRPEERVRPALPG